jgi:hypothetical protein
MAGVAAAIAIAAIGVFAGIRATEGDPEIPEELLATQTAVPVPDSVKTFYATIKRPREPATFPDTIVIGAEDRIPYDAAALFARITATPSNSLWLIKYDSNPEDDLSSTLAVEGDGDIQKQNILPWDGPVYQPLLDYAGVPLEVRTDVGSAPPASAPESGVTPVPAPTKVTIRGVDVTLPAGARLSKGIGDPVCTPGDVCAPFRYSIIRGGDSFIAFTETGVYNHRISPTDASTFEPLLSVLNSLEWESPP